MVNPLARVIMEKNLKAEPKINKREVNKIETTKINNLDEKEIKTISEIIKGQKEIIEGSKKNTSITLDEAVNRIKNNR